MLVVPMDAPVELRRWSGDARGKASAITIATGPFIIMAHGLMALAPAVREQCWIATPTGDLTAGEVEEMLALWSGKAA